jgi:hypothetical protein
MSQGMLRTPRCVVAFIIQCKYILCVAHVYNTQLYFFLTTHYNVIAEHAAPVAEDKTPAAIVETPVLSTQI